MLLGLIRHPKVLCGLTMQFSRPVRNDCVIAQKLWAGATGRVRGHAYQCSLPSEPYVRLATHTAQAFAKAPCGTRRLLNRISMIVDLPVTIRVQQLQVVHRIAATVALPDAVMNVTGFLNWSERLSVDHRPGLFP